MAEEKKQQKEHGAKKEISKEHLPEIKPGMTIRVYQKITEMGCGWDYYELSGKVETLTLEKF